MLHVMLPSPESLPEQLRNSHRWLVWKAEQRGDKVAKVPCDRAGQTASMKDHLTDISQALYDARKLRSKPGGECYGVGYCFGEQCGLVCLDLDNAIGTDYLQWFIDTFPTWAEISLSGNGAHLFFTGRFPGKRSIVIDGAKVEIFGERGFIAVTGEQIPNTVADLGEFAPVGESLAPYLVKGTPPKPKASTQQANNSDRYRGFGQAILKEDCDKILASVDGQKHYTLRDAAFHCGKFIPLCYSFHEAESALRDAIASRGCADLKAAWHTIETGLRKGALEPDSVPELAEPQDVDLSEWGKKIDAEPAARTAVMNEFPASLLNVPGFIGEVMAFTRSRSFVDQPTLALAGALSLLAALTGRKVRDASGTRTSIYVLGVARTGHGKDMARKINKEILYAAAADSLIGPEGLASSAGLVSAMESKLCCLFQLDEIGRLLKTTSNPASGSHLYNIITELLKFYTSSDSVYLGNAYGDMKLNKTINQPCAVLYGTTVPEPLYSAFTPDSISSGWLGRCLIFESPDQRPAKSNPVVADAPESVIEFARSWWNFKPGGNLSIENPSPVCVPADQAAVDKILEFDFYADEQTEQAGPILGCLWSRATEKARKLALLHACSRAVASDARIDLEAASWACELTDYLTRRIVYLASWNVSENGTESSILRIEKIISDSGKRGITLGDLHNKTRWATKRERSDALENLIISGKVVSSTIPTGGRPITTYRST